MKKLFYGVLLAVIACSCNNQPNSTTATTSVDSTRKAQNDTASYINKDTLPAPFATKSVRNFSKVIGWPEGKTPIAPAGFTVTKFAGGLNNPRWIYQAPNGDIFVAQSNTVAKGIRKIEEKIVGKTKSQNMDEPANNILLFRNGKQYVFAQNLNRPFGMLVMGSHFYIANTDALDQFDYSPGDTAIREMAKTILSLPGGGYNNHWTRNIIADKTGKKIMISVGSGSNAGEHGPDNEKRRANILEINPDGSGETIYASGLRNPVGMGWEPVTGRLWAAVNERDELGDELVPDYITSVQEHGFYGWPYSYYGQHVDPRLNKDPHPELVAKAIVPDYPVGAHTASLGFSFYNANTFPASYRGGAFVGQHGSWNKSTLAGYKVIFVPFAGGKPSGKAQDFLTGFIADAAKEEVYGRPVGVTVLKDGSLLVADDAGNSIWKVEVGK